MGRARRPDRGQEREHGGVPRRLPDERGLRPHDRPLERRLRRSRQLHTHALPLPHRPLAKLVFLAASGRSSSRRRAGEGRPAIREALYRKFEGLLQESAALVPLFHDIDYRLVEPSGAGPQAAGHRALRQLPADRQEPSRPPELAEPAPTGGGIVQVPVAGVPSHLDPPRANLARAARDHPEHLRDADRRRGRRPLRALARFAVRGRGGRPSLPLPPARRRALSRRPAPHRPRRPLLVRAAPAGGRREPRGSSPRSGGPRPS